MSISFFLRWQSPTHFCRGPGELKGISSSAAKVSVELQAYGHLRSMVMCKLHQQGLPDLLIKTSQCSKPKDHTLPQAVKLAILCRQEVQEFLSSSQCNRQIVPETKVQSFPGSVVPYSLAQHQVPRQVRPAQVIFRQNFFMQ